MAELCVIAICKDPVTVALIKMVDVLAVDELGVLDATKYSCMDIIFRRIRGVNTHMGGVLIISTIDDKQLQPIEGFPVLLSPHIITCFTVKMLTESVRAATCKTSRRINEINRLPYRALLANRTNLINEYRGLLEKFTFVDSWDDPIITREHFRIFARCAPADRAKFKFVEETKQEMKRGGIHFQSHLSEDVQVPVESHRDWQPATIRTVRILNKKAKEPKELLLFQGGLYVFTFNDRQDRFKQSRLAYLSTVPASDDLAQGKPIAIWAAPPGCKTPPPTNATREQLLNLGWRNTTVGLAPEQHYTLSRLGIKAMRRQYGIQHYVASTIHAGMGATLRKMVTQIVPLQEGDHMSYHLWLKAQLVVLTSRTSAARDNVFVGDKEKTINELVRALHLRSHFTAYMETVIETLAGIENTDPVLPLFDPAVFPYRQRDFPLPSDLSGFSYLLVSTKDWCTCYIGETLDMDVRLKAHNSGNGAIQTQPVNLRPWILVSFVVGFQGDKTEMKSFERKWQDLSRYYTRSNRNANQGVQTVIDAGKNLVRKYRDPNDILYARNLELVFVQTADIDYESTAAPTAAASTAASTTASTTAPNAPMHLLYHD